MEAVLSSAWFHVGMVIILALNIGTSYERCRQPTYKGFTPLNVIIWKYDAALGWTVALCFFIMYVGAKS
jgi:hypothetical protein